VRRDQPSLTAQRVAFARAAHQLYDHPKILDDPLALQIIGAGGAAGIRAHRARFDFTLARYLRAFVVARSRIAEDALAAAVARGVRQYVILGAGLDTFAYRNPYPAALLRVFEVDHPATQAWKQRSLSEAAIAAPESLTFVPIDFETETLAARLAEAGLRTDAPAAFSWLGVTVYLSHDAIRDTLRYVATALPRGSGIVFDYAVPLSAVSLLRRLTVRLLMHRVAAAGEPWKTFFDPQTLAAELRTLGFAQVEDFGPDELNARFFKGRADGLEVGRLGHVMSARS
jgi:methyltransferase (TIGR00027 family)